jgi:hypothetical protein
MAEIWSLLNLTRGLMVTTSAAISFRRRRRGRAGRRQGGAELPTGEGEGEGGTGEAQRESAQSSASARREKRDKDGDRERWGKEEDKFDFFVFPLFIFNNYVLVPRTSIALHFNPLNLYHLTF